MGLERGTERARERERERERERGTVNHSVYRVMGKDRADLKRGKTTEAK